MKKTHLILSLGLLLSAFFCFEGQAQTQHKKAPKPQINYRYTGPINKKELTNSRYTKRWFNPRYERYSPSEKTLNTIKKHINDYKIVAFMGTWCPDSHREIPKLYKILDDTHFNMEHFKMYALAHGMNSKDHSEKGYDIHRVPTIIFYKDGKEIGRFVEHARKNLEKDIARIVSGKPYENYLEAIQKRKHH